MGDSHFKIHLEQLRDGQTIQIKETFPSEFLDVHEKDLDFKNPVTVEGEAYLAGDALVLNLDIHTIGTIPCSVCNKPVEIDIQLDGFNHFEPVSDIRGGLFDYKEVLREAILLETPAFAECSKGKCPKRKEIQKYLKSDEKNPEEGYHPFANL